MVTLSHNISSILKNLISDSCSKKHIARRKKQKFIVAKQTILQI